MPASQPTASAPARSLRHEVSEAEWQVRVDLAAAYRLAALFGWDDLIYTHISAALPGTNGEHSGQFLINPYGFMFEEITASSLVRIDTQGTKLDNSPYEVNPPGFVIHSAVHAARHDAGCVMHLHSINGVAVSSQKGGVLPISQHSMFVLASLGYHDYEGVAVRDEEKPRLVADLGNKAHLMLRNHGLLTVGRTVAEAFQAMYFFETTCMIQLRAQSGGGELIRIPEDIVQTAREQSTVANRGAGTQRAWPGLLRRLDRRFPGYDT